MLNILTLHIESFLLPLYYINLVYMNDTVGYQYIHSLYLPYSYEYAFVTVQCNRTIHAGKLKSAYITFMQYRVTIAIKVMVASVTDKHTRCDR